MTSKHLRIGIIGAGGIVKSCHAPELAKIDNVSITGVCNSTTSSAKRFADQWAKNAIIYDSASDLINSDCDIVWIGTPPYMHCQLTCASLKAGKHVFCQSRMAMSVDEAILMLNLSQKYPKLTTTLCPPPMGVKADPFIKHLISAGTIGRPHQLILHSSSNKYLDPKTEAHWRQKYQVNGIHVLKLGMYIEILHRWFGKITTVYAEAQTMTPVRNGYQVKIPDSISLLCQFGNGIQSNMFFTGIASHSTGDRLEVYGDKGTIIYEFKTERILLGTIKDQKLNEIIPPPNLTKDWSIESEFIASVRDRRLPKPRPTFQDGVDYMRVIEAAHQSIKERRLIEVEH